MDVVIFELEGQSYALPANKVAEILEPLPVTPLPFAPNHVDGLVNVSGRVVVQMDAAVRLGFARTLANDSGNLLVVAGNGDWSAVHVGKVLAKVSIRDDEFTACGAAGEGGLGGEERAGASAVRGEFPWNGRPVLLLDEEAFSIDDFAPVGVPEGGGGLLGQVHAAESQEPVAEGGDLPCLVVACRGERYAFPLDEVGEVIETGRLTVLPHAPAELRGMAVLRGAPMLAVSLGTLLGGCVETAEAVMVIVEVQGLRIGLLAERVLGIERFAKASLQEAAQGREIEGYLVGRDDAMIGLLRIEGLWSRERFEAYRGFLLANKAETKMANDVDGSSATRRMLAFRIGRERCALPLECVERIEEWHEATNVPDGETAGVDGVVQIHGVVAPVVDLGRAMGFAGNNTGAYLVVRVDDGLWALSVERVERVVEVPEKHIEPIRRAASDYVGAVGRLNGELLSIVTLEPLKEAA